MPYKIKGNVVMEFEELLEIGVKKEIIYNSQKTELLNIVQEGIENNSLVIVKILYYIGGFIMICSMFAIMKYIINNSSYPEILSLSIIYGILFFMVGEFLWKKNEKFPSNILYFLLICTFSFFVLAIEKMIGFFPHFSDMNIYDDYFEKCRLPILTLAFLTFIANIKLQKYRKVSMLTIPSIFCMYAVYMIIIHCFIGNQLFEIEPYVNSSLVYSILLIIFAFIKERKIADYYLEWLYFFGAAGVYYCMIVFFCCYFNSYAKLNANIIQFQVFLLSILYCLFGSFINRKPFIVIGLLGAIEYIMYLEFHYIEDNTLLLTSILLITGIVMLYLGVLFGKNSVKISTFLEKLLPEKYRAYLPKNRN